MGKKKQHGQLRTQIKEILYEMMGTTQRQPEERNNTFVSLMQNETKQSLPQDLGTGLAPSDQT